MNRHVKYIIGSAALLIVTVGAISLYNGRVRQNALVLMSGQTPSVIGTATGTNPIIATTTSNPMEPNKNVAVDNSPKPRATVSPARSSPTPTVSKTGCGLHLSVVPRSKTVTPTGTIVYDLTLTNEGTVVCKNTSISVYYNENETFVSATPAPTANNYYFYVGDLPPGAVFKTTIVTRHTRNGSPQISNEVCAAADNVNDACVDNLILIDDSGASQDSSTPIASAPAESLKTPDTLSVSINADIGLLVENSGNKEVGIWEWNSPLQMSSAYQNQVLSLLKKYGFNTIYITIDDYLKIAALTDTSKKTAEKDVYFSHLAAFVSIARVKGFSVDVEGGWKDWSFPENRHKGYALIDFVEEYNRLYPNQKVRSLQFDVEPYLLPGYDENRGPILVQYLEFLDESVKRMQKVDAEFSIVVPHFYHSVKQWTPAITYNGKTAYPYTHILEILSKKSGSKVLVMAYRNFFEGEDGIQEIATPNLSEASRGNYPVKVVIAQETGNVDPEYVTFHRMSKKDLSRALTAIVNTYKNETSFGGVAINYVDPFFQLK